MNNRNFHDASAPLFTNDFLHHIMDSSINTDDYFDYSNR
ncbi:Hypothetical protein ACI5QL_03728 [Bacillus velezensis]|uniref:Uncharacterized protein n=1 Tax=Bacillus amyloliquefaciens (strain Y2) TaxID=1155777 RepID=I2CAZ9_BACAY|nr:hypothetical protein MUS_3972 [Bacillus velezensis YAU B9601-Y2]RUS05203.1 hypothetical protein EFW58_02929 [Bacillus velezensis]